MKIVIQNLQKKVPVNPKRIKQAVLKACSLKNLRKSGEITICLAGNRKIKELNARYLKVNAPTDVIAFDISCAADKKNILADIVISTDMAMANAKTYKTTPLYETYLYVLHGVLHLLGYTDRNARQRRIMAKQESRLLKGIRIK